MTDTSDQAIEELLVFYVNGTLAAEERATVDAALAERPDLRAEVEVLRSIREKMQAEQTQSPGEFGLARLMRDVRKEEEARPEPAGGGGRPWIWQVAAGIALVLLLAQSALLLRQQDGGVQLAGGDGAAMRVTFLPSATEADIRDLLLDLELEIVSGPSAIGVYEIEALDETSIEAAARALQGATDIVESVDLTGD